MKGHGETLITIGTDTVVLERRGRSAPIVARILERSVDAYGNPTWLLCDRRIHKPHEDSLGEWLTQGAIVTALVRAHSAT